MPPVTADNSLTTAELTTAAERSRVKNIAVMEAPPEGERARYYVIAQCTGEDYRYVAPREDRTRARIWYDLNTIRQYLTRHCTDLPYVVYPAQAEPGSAQ